MEKGSYLVHIPRNVFDAGGLVVDGLDFFVSDNLHDLTVGENARLAAAGSRRCASLEDATGLVASRVS